MKKLVKHSVIKGKIKAPASKSMMQRAIAAALLAHGETVLHNPSFCDDSLSSMNVATCLGSKIEKNKNTVLIKGGLKPICSELNCGEAGLCIRMFSPIAALSTKELILTGKGSLKYRPVSMIEKPLHDLGASCEINSGLIPIKVKGPLKGGKTTIDGSVSSQFLTGLLIALPCCNNDSELIVKDLKSSPYIDMTIETLEKFGITIKNYNYKRFLIKGGQKYKSCNFIVEGDWSGAAFLLVAAALCGEIEMNMINPDSRQADRKILDALKRAGAEVITSDKTVIVKKRELKAFEFDATECPDLFPPLIALSSQCEGLTSIKGVKRLRFKETDRAMALKKEFTSIGAEIDINGNIMSIRGGKIRGGCVSSHNDHRMAMATAIAGVVSLDKVEIDNAECVAKSYPSFFKDLKSIGGNVYE